MTTPSSFFSVFAALLSLVAWQAQASITCATFDSSDCISEWINAKNNKQLSSFYNRCQTDGGAQPLRARCSKCCPDPSCAGGQVWQASGPACIKTCDELNPYCGTESVAMCKCPPQKPVWHNGQCTWKGQCPTPSKECRWVGDSAGSDSWCNANCNHVPSFCPEGSCDCSAQATPAPTQAPTPTPTPAPTTTTSADEQSTTTSVVANAELQLVPTVAGVPRDSNYSRACSEEFGSGARTADWEIDIEARTTEQMQTLFSTHDIQPFDNSYLVTRAGNMTWQGARKYFVQRHDGNPPGNWDVHAQKSGLTLGSWTGGTMLVLCAIPTTTTTTTTATTVTAEHVDCSVLPISMNGINFARGCAGAVFGNGMPAQGYCTGHQQYPWWSFCCRWSGDECQSKDGVTTITSTTTTTTTTTTPTTCADWCEANSFEWEAKCSWGSCKQCAQCPEEPAACKTWCAGNGDDWTTKCTWGSCEQCGECSAGRRLDENNITTDGTSERIILV